MLHWSTRCSTHAPLDSLTRENDRDKELLAMTVSDDNGMRIAARSGLMNPVIASTTATTL